MHVYEAQTILLNFLFVVICVKLVFYVWYICRVYFLTRIGFRKSLKHYGEWAVVTGCTDGIGREYAKQLAGHGLNIVLISRTKSKLEKVSTEIEKMHSVETRIIVFDFSTQEGYYRIAKEMEDLPIGILVNNVGTTSDHFETFVNHDIEEIVGTINTNLMSNVRMTHLILPGMLTRRKGVIVHITSGSVFPNLVSMGVYPSTKIFLQKFCRLLQLETQGVVEHQLLTTMCVATKGMKMQPTVTIPSPREYVESAIRTIGVASESCGYLSHELVYLVMLCVPDCVVNFVFTNIFIPKMKKYRC